MTATHSTPPEYGFVLPGMCRIDLDHNTTNNNIKTNEPLLQQSKLSATTTRQTTGDESALTLCGDNGRNFTLALIHIRNTTSTSTTSKVDDTSDSQIEPHMEWILCRIGESSSSHIRQYLTPSVVEVCYSPVIIVKAVQWDDSTTLSSHLRAQFESNQNEGSVHCYHSQTYRTKSCICQCSESKKHSLHSHLYIDLSVDATCLAQNNNNSNNNSNNNNNINSNNNNNCPSITDFDTTITLFTPNQHPVLIPAISIQFKYIALQKETHDTHSIELQPLLYSCVKRQLVGCPILYEEGSITTEIRLPIHVVANQTWELTVTSLTISRTKDSYRSEVVIAHILPSTRITLIPTISQVPQKEKVPSPNTFIEFTKDQENDSHLSISPTARILLDTILCIRYIARPIDNRKQLTRADTCDIPRIFLLSGPPGTGKTYSVRLATQFTPQPYYLDILQGSDILSNGHVAQAALNLQNRFQQAAIKIQQSTSPSAVAVIFLDECDALVSPNEHDSYSVIEATLTMLLDKVHDIPAWRRLVVVAATNRADTLPIRLRRRFDREITLRPPNTETRLLILKSLLRAQYGNDVDQWNDELYEIASSCIGYVPADIAALVRRVELLRITALSSNLHHEHNSDDIRLSCHQICSYLHQAMPLVGASALRDAALQTIPSITFDDIAGDPGGAKTALRQAIEWPRTKRQAYLALGLTAPRGILLYGPPGCAKTTLARAAAGATNNTSFRTLSPADVYSSSYVGDAEAVVRQAFAQARATAPCILFFDEIDAILGSSYHGDAHGMGRRGTSNSAEIRVMSTFLNEMDGVDASGTDGVLVLGATNRPETLDVALLRPGRFDKVIYVPPPDYEGRRSILSKQCQNWNCFRQMDLDKLASNAVTGSMTGAEIVGACRHAVLLSVRRGMPPFTMREEYLQEALEEIQPLLSNPAVLFQYQSFEQRRQQHH